MFTSLFIPLSLFPHLKWIFYLLHMKTRPQIFERGFVRTSDELLDFQSQMFFYLFLLEKEKLLVYIKFRQLQMKLTFFFRVDFETNQTNNYIYSSRILKIKKLIENDWRRLICWLERTSHLRFGWLLSHLTIMAKNIFYQNWNHLVP